MASYIQNLMKHKSKAKANKTAKLYKNVDEVRHEQDSSVSIDSRDLLQTAEPAEQRCAVPSRAGIPSCYRARIRRRWSRDRGIPCSAQHSAALLGRLGGL